MPGFPLAALGAGLGQWAKYAQDQAAQRERQQMLMLQLQNYQQQMQDRQQERQSAEGLWGALGGGGGIKPVDPTGGSAPRGVGVPMARGEVGGGALTSGDDIKQRESSGNYNVGYGGADLSKAPLGPDGFPQWPGKMGPAGMSHAAGAYQFQPGTWRPYAEKLGIHDFSPASQDAVFNAAHAAEGDKPWAASAPRGGAGSGNAQIPGYPTIRPGAAGQADRDYIRANPREMQVADASGAQPADASGGDAPAASTAPVPIPDLRKRLNAIIRPDLNGRMNEAELKAKIDQACPTCPAVYKLKYLDSELKRLAPMEAERVKAAHDQYKTQIDAETEMWKEEVRRQDKVESGGAIVSGPDGGQFSVQGRTARPIKIEGTGEQLKDATRLSGTGASTASAGREKDVVGEIKRLDDDYAAANPNATKAEKDAAHFNNRKTAEKALTAAKTSEGRNPAAMYMRKYLEQNPEATPADISRASAGFVRDQSIERNFAGGSGATQMRSLNTVADHLSLMRGYADALQTGDIPRVNQLQQLLSKETGWPEVTNFNVARDIMADEVVRLLTSTGGTEADRAGMQSRFAAAASPDQMHGALEAAERFVAGRFKGLEQNYARNDATRRREFEQEMLTPEARNMFTKYGQQPGGAPAQAAPAAQPPQAAPAGPAPAGVIRYDAQGNRIQ